MKHFLHLGLATGSLLTSLHGAVYTTNFNNYGGSNPNAGLGSDIAGKDGWTINDSTDQFSQVAKANVNPAAPGNTSKALNLGDASAVNSLPSGSSVALSHGYAATVSNVQLTFDTVILDSVSDDFSADPGVTTPVYFKNRDKFGVSVSSGGVNVFSLSMIPTSQSSDPTGGAAAQWDIYYTVGTGAAISLGLGVLESAQYHFDLGFSKNSGNPLLTDFSLSVTSAIPNTLTNGAVGLTLNPNTSIDALNISWSKQGGADFGSNSILVDNLSIVPEPSAAILFGLAGLGYASRRKRA